MISNIHRPEISSEMLACNELQQKIMQLLLTDMSTKTIVQFSYDSILDKVQKFLRSLSEEVSAEPLTDEKDEQYLRQEAMNMETESEKGEDEIQNQGGKGQKDESGKALPSNIIEPSIEAEFTELVNRSPSKEKGVAKLEHHQNKDEEYNSTHKISFNIDSYLNTPIQKQLKLEYTKQLILKNFETDEKPSKKHAIMGKLQKEKNVVNLIDESEEIQEQRNVLANFMQNQRQEDLLKLKKMAKVEWCQVNKEEIQRNSNAIPYKRTDLFGISKKQRQKIVIDVEEDERQKDVLEKIESSLKRQQSPQKKKNEIKKKPFVRKGPRFPKIEESVAKIILKINKRGIIPKSYEVLKWAKEKATQFYPQFVGSLDWLKGFSQRNPNIKFELNYHRQPRTKQNKSKFSENIENFDEKYSSSIELDTPEYKYSEVMKKKKIIEKSPIMTRRLTKLQQKLEKK